MSEAFIPVSTTYSNHTDFLYSPPYLYKRVCPSVCPSVRPVLFSKVKSTHTRRILCRVSGLVSVYPRSLPCDGSVAMIEYNAKNKAVYTTAPVAGGWTGAVMIWAGAVMIWAGAVMI